MKVDKHLSGNSELPCQQKIKLVKQVYKKRLLVQDHPFKYFSIA